MTKLDKVLCFAPLCSTWGRLNGKFFAAWDRNNSNLIVQKGSISRRLRRHGVDEVMARLDKVLCFVPLFSTWDRLNGKFNSAQDRNNFKLSVQRVRSAGDFVDKASTRSCRSWTRSLLCPVVFGLGSAQWQVSRGSGPEEIQADRSMALDQLATSSKAVIPKLGSLRTPRTPENQNPQRLRTSSGD